MHYLGGASSRWLLWNTQLIHFLINNNTLVELVVAFSVRVPAAEGHRSPWVGGHHHIVGVRPCESLRPAKPSAVFDGAGGLASAQPGARRHEG